MFYLNLGSMVPRTFVVFIFSNFSFLSMGCSFSRTFEKLLCNFFSKITLHDFSELYVQSFSVIDLYRIACEVCMNFEQSIPANSFSKVFVPGVV